MLKSEAAAYLAGVTQTEGAEASAPTNLHVITGEVGETSEDGKARIKIDGLVFSESNDQYIAVDALGGLEEGDIATLILSGEQGHAMTPLAIGSIGSIDRITVRIAAIEADYIKVQQLDAAEARIDELEADHVSVDDLDAATARIGTLETTRATITDLEAAEARIHSLEVDHVTVDNFEAATARIGELESDHVSTDDLEAATGRIGQLEADTADIDTIRANSAKVQNLTAAQLEADHAAIESLDSNYAHITNGVIDNATIGYADVNNLSAHYAEIQNGKINSALIDTAAIVDEQVFTVTGNKATLSEINADTITVRNLHTSNLTVDTANGYVTIGNKQTPTKEFLDSLKDELQQEIDGAVETFTSSAVPLLNNYPASEWIISGATAEEQRRAYAKHVGDICYVQNSALDQNGYAYRFAYDSTEQAFKWVLVKDSDVTKALGDISDLKTFESDTTTWMEETDEGLTTIRQNHTALSGVVDKTVVETKQLWFTKSNTTAPNKPTAQVTSTSTAGNAWRVVVPAYNASYPNYYYCLQYKLADGTYAWSDVVRDIAMGESQQQGRKGVADAATAQSTADSATTAAATADGKAVAAQSTANANIKSSVQLWFTKANTTAPNKPTAQVTVNDASKTNQWNLAIPTYSSSYPNYFYCYQQQKGDGTWQWTDVVYDRSITEAQAKAQSALPSSEFNTFKTTTFKEVVDEVGENSTSISTLSESVSKKADSSTVTTLSNTVNTVKQTADTNKTSITNLTKTVFDNKTAIETRASTIEQNLSGITTRVGSLESTTTNHGTRLTNAETTIEQNAEAISLSAQKVSSRGLQLVTNGNGFMGNNTNWPTLTFDGSVTNGSPGSFTRAVPGGYGQTIISDEPFPIDQSKEYIFEFDAMSADGTARLYAFLLNLDVDKQNIGAQNVFFFRNTLTTLASDLNPGDTTIKLTSAANWASTSADNQRSIVFWDYQNSYGYLYPEETYSRNYYYAIYADDSKVNKSTGVITLKSAWTGPKKLAGTKVSQNRSGASYNYAIVNVLVPNTWTHYSFVYSGMNIAKTGNDVPGKFRQATAFAKVGFLWNYSASTSNPQGQLWVTNISVKENVATQTALAAIKATTDGISSTVEKIRGVKYLTSPSSGASLANIQTYSAEGTTATWAVTPGTTSDLRVGDTIYLQYKDTTRNCYVYIKGTVNGFSNSNVNFTAHGYEDVLPVATVISTINQSAETVKIKAEKVEIDGTAVFSAISSDVDDAITDKGYQTSSQVESAITSKGYATTTQAQGYATTAKTEAVNAAAADATSKANAAEAAAKSAIPSDISELNNDAGFITSADVPTKVSELTNDSGFQNSTQVNTAITSKGYQTSSQVESAITSKGYATTTKAQGYASTAKSEAISAAATDATTKANAAEANAKAYTDALEIGGRNLLQKTERPSSDNVYLVRSAIADGVIRTAPTTSNAYADWKVNYLDYAEYNDGEYTVSVDARLSSSSNGYTSINSIIYLGYKLASRWGGTFSSNYDRFTSKSISGITNEWKRVSVTFKVPDDLKSGQASALVAGSFLSVEFYCGKEAAAVDWRRPKLEKGNKATDWSPAPEDVAADIAAAQATANAAAPKANAVKRTQRIWYRTNGSSAPSTPGTASSNWVTKADDGNDAWTKMHIAISSTHKYIYTCEQYEMADGTVGYTSVLLDNTITVIDGGNIITGSVTANKLNAANINASKTLTVGAMTDAAASSILNSNVVVGGRNLLRGTDTGTGWLYSNFDASARTFTRETTATSEAYVNANSESYLMLELGVDYTLSCWAKSNGQVSSMDMYCFDPQVKNIRSSRNLALTTSWEQYVFTFRYDSWDSGSSPTGFIIRFDNNGSKTSGTNSILYIREPKLEKGNKATDWTPAPEDMATAESLAGTNESLDGAIEDIGELSDQLVGTVTEQNKTITDIQTYLNSLRKDLDAEIQSRQQWLNFNSAEGLVIGAAGSTFKTVTTNTSQQFRSGGTVLAETSGTEFVAPVMRSDQLLIGNWMWTRRDNGNLSLKWIG